MTAPLTATNTQARRELYELMSGAATGEIRPSITDSLVPLYASALCGDALTVFQAGVVALREQRMTDVAEHLNSLMAGVE